MDKNMTLEKRIAAELYSYQGKMRGRLVKENVNASIVCKDLLIAEVAIRQGCWSKMPPEQSKKMDGLSSRCTSV